MVPQLGRMDRRGSVFVTTMIAMLIMLLTGSYLYSMSDTGMHNVKQIQQRSQARYLAEAGLAAAMADLKTNWQNSRTYSSVNLGTGSYSAVVATTSGRTLITATGSANGVTQVATAEVSPPGVSALDYVFAAGGNAVIDSGTGHSPGTIDGDIYGGGNVTLDGPSSGGNLVLTGDVDAGGSITTGSNVSQTGTNTPNFSPSVTFPVPNYGYYQTIAQTNGFYYSSSRTYNSSTPIPAAPAGGVIFVDGDVTINGGTHNTTACIVATGNISLNKSGSSYPRVTVTAFSPSAGIEYPAIICAGNFSFSTTGNASPDAYLYVDGLLYTGGNFTLSLGNHHQFTVDGAVVSLGNITLSPQSHNTITGGYQGTGLPPGFTGGAAEMEVVSYNA